MLQMLNHEAAWRSSVRIVDELLERLASVPSDADPNDFSDRLELDSLRELVIHLRVLGMVGVADCLKRHYVNQTNWTFIYLASDLARERTPRKIKSVQSQIVEFPLPFSNPAEQDEVQADRRLAIEGNALQLAERLRTLRTELQNIRASTIPDATTKTAQVTPGAADGKRQGSRRRKPRGAAKHLTRLQEAAVSQIEDLRLSVSEIAGQRRCSESAVRALYARAKKNPGYKGRRSINLGKTQTIHPNTRRKNTRPEDSDK